MVMRNREAAGFLLSILFVGLAALRDVYFGGLFQRVQHELGHVRFPGLRRAVAPGAPVSLPPPPTTKKKGAHK